MAARSRRAVAHQVARRLYDEGFSNVALIGSVARGDDSDGSDIDVWVLDEREHRRERRVSGHPVTVIFETPAQCRSLDHLLRVEVQHAQILFDDDGSFSRLKRRFARQRKVIRRLIQRATFIEVDQLMRAAQRGPVWRQVLLLRAAAIRVVSLPIYRATDVRDSRWRHFVAHLQPAQLRLLRAVLGLRTPELRSVGGVEWDRTPALLGAAAKWVAGEREEAALKARHALDSLTGFDLMKHRVAPSDRSWAAAQAISARPRVASLRRAVQELRRQLW